MGVISTAVPGKEYFVDDVGAFRADYLLLHRKSFDFGDFLHRRRNILSGTAVEITPIRSVDHIQGRQRRSRPHHPQATR